MYEAFTYFTNSKRTTLNSVQYIQSKNKPYVETCMRAGMCTGSVLFVWSE